MQPEYQIPNCIHFVFHNLSVYDAHLFIKELGRRFNKNYIGVIAEKKVNKSVLMLKLTSSWLGLSIRMVQKNAKIFNLDL